MSDRSGAEHWAEMASDFEEIFAVLQREQLEQDMHRNMSETALWMMAAELYSVRHETTVLPPETQPQ